MKTLLKNGHIFTNNGFEKRDIFVIDDRLSLSHSNTSVSYTHLGHVSVIIGSRPYEELAEKYHKPFVVAGFEAEHILAVIYDIVRQLERKEACVKNRYTNAVREEGNLKALQVLEDFFEPGPAMWRGLGVISDSGQMCIRDRSKPGNRRLLRLCGRFGSYVF